MSLGEAWAWGQSMSLPQTTLEEVHVRLSFKLEFFPGLLGFLSIGGRTGRREWDFSVGHKKLLYLNCSMENMYSEE